MMSLIHHQVEWEISPDDPIDTVSMDVLFVSCHQVMFHWHPGLPGSFCSLKGYIEWITKHFCCSWPWTCCCAWLD
ncbi:hypothetical protein AOLI_G00289090 [Acnodon oligacanthus]